MNHGRAITTGLLLAAAVAAGCGQQQQVSVVAVPFTVQVDRGALRPAGSSVGIVGNHPSLGATADQPEGDPLRALKLRQLPDDVWTGAAWLPPGAAITYVVYMLDPAAPELVGQVKADGTTEPVLNAEVVRRTVRWDNPYESAYVTVFDVPAGVNKPCVTFVVTVPGNTPAGDTIYMAGNDAQLGPWNPAKKALTRNDDGTYGTELCFDPGKDLKYKYLRNGAWAYVEKDAAGADISDRSLTVTDTANQNDTVEKWADL